MESLKNFIVNNWQYISIALVIVLELVSMLIKRKPKTLDDFFDAISQAVYKLPEMIQTAEQYSPSVRKDLCVSWSFRLISKLLNRGLTDGEKDFIRSKISAQVEDILTCPTKKGGIGREDE